MNCSKCGSYMNDNQAFCPNCGTPNVNQQPQYQQPQYQQPQYQQPQYQQPQYQQPQYQQPQYQQTQYQQTQYQQPQYQPPYQSNEPQLPMNWFKFLIYFSLFASCVLNVVCGITFMTGAQYEGAKDLVYIWFGGMQALDMIYGLGCIAVGVLAIYTRMCLVGFYKNGPQMVNLCYIAGIAVGLIYIIGTSIILGGDVPLNYTSIFTNIGISAAMVVANTVYFKKRAHLFTK